jgi:nitronate monooxygenase
LRAGGIKTMHKCVSVRHAVSAQNAGVDAVTLFGTEGGGHIGEFGLTTMILVPRAADVLDIPLLAAGGIADGRGLLAALALGAEGVTIGTRLLLSEEAPIHDNLKQALLQANETDTLPILGSLHNTLRAWKNTAARQVVEIEAGQGDMLEILNMVAGTKTRRMLQDGDVEAGVIACGQGIGVVNRIAPASEVIDSIVQEAAAIRGRLGPERVC